MQGVEDLISLQEGPPGLLVQRQLLKLFGLLHTQQLGCNVAIGAFEDLVMLGMFGDEPAFLQVENGGLFGIDVLDPESEEAGQVQHKEEREVCLDAAFAGIEVKEGVFDKIEKVRVWFGLFYTFLQKLDHKQGYGIFQDIEEDVLVEGGPFHFLYALEVFEVVVIDDEVENGGRLKEVGFAGAFTGGGTNAADEIGLDAKEFGIKRGDEAGFAVFDCFENDSFGFV